MADEVAEVAPVVTLRDDFYRDSFRKLIFVIISVSIAIICLIALSIYLYLDKPSPILFKLNDEFRVQAPVPLNQPYLSNPDLLQWIGEELPKAFNFDFNNYNQQIKILSQYFTVDGWKIFLNQLNIYANYNNVQTNKLFINGSPVSAPYILKQGLLSGKYAWWVQMPIMIKYAGYKPSPSRTLSLQVLVVRVPTLNNLMGVGIENVIVGNAGESPVENG